MLLAYAKECEKKRLAEVRAGVKTVKVKNEKLNKRRTAKSFIPKSTQDDLPYVADFDEGVFEAEPGKYSKTYLFTDINYLTAKQEEAEAIFCKWRDFLNCFSEEITLAVTTDNCVISVKEQEKKIFRTLTGDAYDIHREEFNKILKKQMMAGNNDIQRFKYITVTISADSAYEAVLRFRREIDALVCDNLKKVGVYGTPLTTDERLSLLHDKMRKGREGEFKINYDFLKAQGLSSKDYVAPSSFFWKPKDYFMVEDTYCCCLYMNNLPSMLADDVYRDINDCPFPLLSTLSIQSMAPEKAIKLVKRQITGMETNKMDAEKKAIRAGYSPEIINHDLIHSLEEGYALLDDIQNKDQKLFFVSILFMVSGDTLDELKENTKLLISKARAATCQMQIFDNQQRDAFKVVMPFGVTPKGKVFVERVLTTESTAVFVPFTNREIFQPGGFYYGLNQISRNLVLCDRTKMKTPSGFILGSSGSGKSFACKREMLSVLLSDDKTGLLVIDPENEYGDFCRVFGGTVVSLSTSSECYINPMDMDENYGLDEEDDIDKTPMEKKKKKALQKKTEYLMSIIQYMVADDNNSTSLSPQQKTIVDRAIRKTYEKYLEQGFDKKYLPTLLDLQEELDEEKKLSEDGRLIAEACAYYTRGSMDLFSHKTNLDLSNRFMVFNIRDLGKELKQISLLIVLDFIWDRMSVNCHKNIRTYCYVDEIHVLVQNPLSERYLQQLYKRGRKYGLVISGITQDVQDLLRSDIAQGMLTNSDFILMLNQKGENLEALSKLLRISEAEAGYVSMAEPGCGLLFAEKTIVPFVDKFPEDSYLYALMSTKFGENNDIDVDAFIEKLQKEQAERELTKKNKVSA